MSRALDEKIKIGALTLEEKLFKRFHSTSPEKHVTYVKYLLNIAFEEAEKKLFSKNESFENLRRLYDEVSNDVMQGS